MKKALLFTTLVAILVFAFVGTAFAAYSQTFTVPALAPGDVLTIDPGFFAPYPDPVSNGYYLEVRVEGPGAETNVVGEEGDFMWWPPVPSESGPGFIHFASDDYVQWVEVTPGSLLGGYTGRIATPAPYLTFNSAGTYTLEIRLIDEILGGSTYPAPAGAILQTTTYDVVVAAPPVVSTPASSAWSIALLAVGALGVALVGRKVRLPN